METNRGSGLKLHTSAVPPQAAQPNEKAEVRVRWKVLRHTAQARRARVVQPRIRQRKQYVKKRATASERLLRNTAIACAMLLTVMAMRNIDSPVTNQVTGALSRVLSMDLKLDESLGKLSFVQNLMPESALVFLNLTSRDETPLLVTGQAVHAWSEEQPWLEYLAQNGEPVYAMEGGEISACLQSEEGDWTILISHGDGTQAVYAYVGKVSVKTGDRVERAAQIGKAGEDARARLYVEYRVNGEPANPESLLGERGA